MILLQGHPCQVLTRMTGVQEEEKGNVPPVLSLLCALSLLRQSQQGILWSGFELPPKSQYRMNHDETGPFPFE
jgi:hypothetical protein